MVRVVSTDESMGDHARRLDRRTAPRLHAFAAMTMEERWVSRSPAQVPATFPWFAGEGFDLVVADVLALPVEPVVVVEGFRLLPSRVAPPLAGPGQAVWLLPTPAFRRSALAARGSTWEIAGRTGTLSGRRRTCWSATRGSRRAAGRGG